MTKQLPIAILALVSVATQVAEPQKPIATTQASARSADNRRPILPADVAAWKSITGAKLTRNGEWFGYALTPVEGDAELVVRSTRSGKELRFPVGDMSGTGAGTFAFSDDGRWLAFLTGPRRKETERLRHDKKPIQTSATIVELATGKLVEFPRVKSITFDGKRSGAVAMQVFPDPATAPAKTGGADVILYDLASATPLNLGNVGEFSFDHSGTWLVWTVDARDQIGNGVRIRNLTTGMERVVDGDRSVYRGLTWADSSTTMALMKGAVDSIAKDTIYQIISINDITQPTSPITAFLPSEDASFPRDMTIGASRTLRWSEDHGTIFFGIRPKRVRDASPPLTDKPNIVIWHWKEPRIQSQQQVERARDEAYTYLSEYRLADRKFIRLANDTFPEVAVAPKDKWALAWDEREYATKNSLDGREFVDIYAIDLATGARKRLLQRYMLVNGFARMQYYSFSPDGTHFLSWNDGAYTVHDMSSGESHPLVRSGTVSFVNVEDDHPRIKPPNIPVAWSKDGGTVLLTDRWDIWAVPLATGRPINLTVNGKKAGIRYSTINQSLTGGTSGRVDLTKLWYVAARAEFAKDAGVVRIDGSTPGAHRTLWDSASFSTIVKATDANTVIYTRATPLDFPDYYLTDISLAKGSRITDANPQQREYLWPSGTIVVDYIGPKGEKLQASLLLPANYEKGKKYPALMHIYEHRSGNRINYDAPSYSQALNGTLYASRGYVVISPDINYKVDAPGTSSVKCVLAAAKAAIATGIVDSARLGLHGHSWGGYQTAFIITQTPLFKAAVAGAAPTNMISFYGDIYWNTGRMIAPIFEADQARLSTPYWEKLDVYLRESPVFHARNVKTPLVILQNDKDGAVDWHQGIEYYNVLRRLGKPVVMLQYVGENHGVSIPANYKDYAVRMREFFDHYLMGAPAPKWWTDGIPLRKMDDHLRERATSATQSAEK
jgi:dienelactone hydrolase